MHINTILDISIHHVYVHSLNLIPNTQAIPFSHVLQLFSSDAPIIRLAIGIGPIMRFLGIIGIGKFYR